jgi:hypothetical protein
LKLLTLLPSSGFLATPSVFNASLATINDNTTALNAYLSATSIPSLSSTTGTAGQILATVSGNTNTLSLASQLLLPGTLGAGSGNTLSLGTYAVSANTLGATSGNTVAVASVVQLSNTSIAGLGAPSAASDAATKGYVDSGVSAGVATFKPSYSVYSAAVALSQGSFCFITSTSSVSMADSTNSLKAPVANIGLCLTASSGSNVTVTFTPCEVGFYSSLTTGGQYFLNTSGGLTATMPSAASTIVYVLGTARSATRLVFNPVYLGSNAT